MKKKPSKRNKNILIAAISVVLAIIAVIAFFLDSNGTLDDALAPEDDFFQPEQQEETMDVYFMDVGQGDCAILVNNDASMLIDCGESQYSTKVIEKLKALRINKLDYIVVTHSHSDHMGGMAAVIENIGAEHIIISEPSDESAQTNLYDTFMDALDACDAEIIPATPEYTFSVGSMNCKILSPEEVSKNENNNSVVMTVTYGTNSFLFVGDAEKAIEKNLINKLPNDLDVDILKVGHHGSNTSSTDAFIDMITPEVAVISVGYDNKYKHPSDKTLEKFNNRNITYYRTDIVGSVDIKCTKNSYKVITER